nr:integrase, catalytic region, zinc finger, CCHC-type, peptidase aspartic, catalytic [Tanacetum cinerariifolium]
MQDDEVEPSELQEVMEVVITAKLITEVVTAAGATLTAAALQLTIAVAPTLTTAPSAARRRRGYQALKRKPQTEAQARKNMMIYLRNVVGFKMDYFKEMTYDDIRPIFEKKFNSNVAFLMKIKEQIDEEDSRALKRLSESQDDKIAKSRSWMRREDLEALWRLVRERFATTKAKNFSDDFLLTTLGAIFGVDAAMDYKENMLRVKGPTLMPFSFRVDAVKDFKEYTLRDYYCWLKTYFYWLNTYFCWYKLKLLDNAADLRSPGVKGPTLQGLPKDIYTLINPYTDAKDIWDNVKMLLEGFELTKEDQESQLYDDFEHFCQNERETIHAYYVRFAKLINDMRNIKMTMSRMQLNSKFVKNMLPEWGRFMTAVKLNRGLRDSNYDQFYAYLKQHKAHANENKMMLDRFTQHTVDPLALMSNVSHQQPYSESFTTPPSTYVPPHLADNAHLDLGLFLTNNLIKNLTNTLALLT